VTETPQKELDLRQMPIEAVAAYWLSLRKVMGPKVSPKTLQEEAANTAEPFIRYMLDLGLCGLDEATVRRAGERRRDTALRELGRKLGLMRDALLSMAAAENPRLALARMLARLPAPGQGEEGVTRLALDMVRFVEQGGAGTTLAVDTGLSAEELLVRLTFYVLWARREGKAAVWPLGGGSCRFFAQGLALASDGHDRSFVKTCLDTACAEVLADYQTRMDLCVDMVLALRAKAGYEDLYRLARAYVP
jgi:hypothetical protein